MGRRSDFSSEHCFWADSTFHLSLKQAATPDLHYNEIQLRPFYLDLIWGILFLIYRYSLPRAAQLNGRQDPGMALESFPNSFLIWKWLLRAPCLWAQTSNLRSWRNPGQEEASMWLGWFFSYAFVTGQFATSRKTNCSRMNLSDIWKQFSGEEEMEKIRPEKSAVSLVQTSIDN